MEIVVDAYTPDEQAMGWYYSLEDRLQFPFAARCTAERTISPLRRGDEVEFERHMRAENRSDRTIATYLPTEAAAQADEDARV